MTPRKGSVSGATYSTKAVVMASIDIHRALKRIAHEVIERNRGDSELVVVGLQSGGVWVAELLCQFLNEVGGSLVSFGSLDISLYRDDHASRPFTESFSTDVPVSVQDKAVLLVDDVLFTGRSVRAALDAILDFGRPKSIQLAVLVDRGHRELPIRPDFVGKNLPTSKTEMVEVNIDGVTILEEVLDAP